MVLGKHFLELQKLKSPIQFAAMKAVRDANYINSPAFLRNQHVHDHLYNGVPHLALALIHLGDTDDAANKKGDERIQADIQIEELPDDAINDEFVEDGKANTMHLMKTQR